MGRLRAGYHVGGADGLDWMKVCMWHLREHPKPLAALEIKKAGPARVPGDRKLERSPAGHQSGFSQQDCGTLKSQALPLRSFHLNVGVSVLDSYEYLR